MTRIIQDRVRSCGESEFTGGPGSTLAASVIGLISRLLACLAHFHRNLRTAICILGRLGSPDLIPPIPAYSHQKNVKTSFLCVPLRSAIKAHFACFGVFRGLKAQNRTKLRNAIEFMHLCAPACSSVRLRAPKRKNLWNRTNRTKLHMPMLASTAPGCAENL